MQGPCEGRCIEDVQRHHLESSGLLEAAQGVLSQLVCVALYFWHACT